MNEQARYDAKNEPIVLSKVTMDILLKERHSTDLIGLYSFYYYTAKWQETDQAKATNSYVSRGLRWNVNKVIKYRKILESLGLIKVIVRKNEKTGVIIGHYIKVVFFWVKPVSAQNSNETSTIPKTHNVDNENTNALEVIKENALEDKKEASELKPKQEIPIKKPLPQNPTPEVAPCATVPKCLYPTANYNVMVFVLWKQKMGGAPLKSNLKAIKELCGEYGLPTVEKALKWYLSNTDALYISLPSFCSKFGVYLQKAGGKELTQAEKAERDAKLYQKPRDQTQD